MYTTSSPKYLVGLQVSWACDCDTGITGVERCDGRGCRQAVDFTWDTTRELSTTARNSTWRHLQLLRHLCVGLCSLVSGGRHVYSFSIICVDVCLVVFTCVGWPVRLQLLHHLCRCVSGCVHLCRVTGTSTASPSSPLRSWCVQSRTVLITWPPAVCFCVMQI